MLLCDKVAVHVANRIDEEHKYKKSTFKSRERSGGIMSLSLEARPQAQTDINNCLYEHSQKRHYNRRQAVCPQLHGLLGVAKVGGPLLLLALDGSLTALI